jgi:hypothetical protein
MMTLLIATILSAVTTASAPLPQLEPDRIAVDQAAELRVPAGSPAPSAAGLELQRTGQSTEMSIVNGQVSQQSFTLYQVTAQQPGTYSIQIGDAALKLEVAPSGARAQPAMGPQPAARGGPLGLLRVSLPHRKLYVGEAVPVTFEAAFRPGAQVTLNGQPMLTGQSFVVGKLPDQPEQGEELIAGKPYHFARWTTSLSAASAGKTSAVATLPVVVRYRQEVEPAQDPLGALSADDDDPFTTSPSAMMRSMMQRMRSLGGGFFGAPQERELTLRSRAVEVPVEPLPADGRPADFSGAVGHFDLSAAIVESTATQYEPLRLRIAIRGQGNFDRVTTAGLAAGGDWRSYPATSSFAARPGAAGLAGTKTFEQAIAPQKSGALQLPALRFSYFDPERGTYVTRTTEPISVRVEPAAAGQAAAPQPAPASAQAPPEHSATPAAVATNLVPPYRHGWFWLLQLLPLSLLALVLFRRGARGRATSPGTLRKQQDQQLQARRAQMRRALAEGDEAAYFEAAQRALQARLGERFQLDPEQVTAAEVESRLGSEGREAARALGAAERSRYAGRAPHARSLAEWDAVIERELEQKGARP